MAREDQTFVTTPGADMPLDWVAKLNKGQIPRGFGSWMYKRALSDDQRLAVPINANASDPLATASAAGTPTFDPNVFYARKGANAASADGSEENPFAELADALDRVYDNGDAGPSNQYIVDAGEGAATKQAFLRTPYTKVRVQASDSTTLSTSAGIILWWTNATKASVAALEAADGHISAAALDASYGTLVADPAVTTLVGSSIEGLTIKSHTATVPALVYCGVGDGYDTTLDTRHAIDCEINGEVYVRNVGGLDFKRTEVTSKLWVRQARFAQIQRCKLFSVLSDFNQTDPRPAAPYDTLSIIASEYNVLGNDIVLRGEAILTDKQSDIGDAIYFYDTGRILGSGTVCKRMFLDGAANVLLEGGHCEGDVTLTNPTTPLVALKGFDVFGDIDIPAGGSKTFAVSGGSILGTVTDPDEVLAYVSPTYPHMGVPRTPPLTRWALDEGSGLAVADTSPFGHEIDGVADAGITWARGPQGQGALVIPANEQVSMGTGVSEVVLDNALFWELEFWFKVGAIAVGKVAGLFGRVHGVFGVGSRAWRVDHNGHIQMLVGGPGVTPGNESTIVCDDDKWHHFRVAFSGNSRLSWYVDGLRQHHQAYTSTTDDPSYTLYMGYWGPTAGGENEVRIASPTYRLL